MSIQLLKALHSRKYSSDGVQYESLGIVRTDMLVQSETEGLNLKCSRERGQPLSSVNSFWRLRRLLDSVACGFAVSRSALEHSRKIPGNPS